MITQDLGKAGITANSTWNISQTYESNSIVFNVQDNTSYISRRDVPAGVEIDDEYYWQPFVAGPTYTWGTPYFSQTSGNSSVTMKTYYKYGHVCQLMLQLKTQSASLGDSMIVGTFSDLPRPAANGTATTVLVGGAVVGCRLTNAGAFTARLGGMDYTAPSGGGTAYVSIVYFTN